MRYEVVQVLSGTYPARELYAAHHCPELIPTRCRDVAGGPIEQFEAGAVHHLRLDRKSSTRTLTDAFSDKSLPRYVVGCANLSQSSEPVG
ncbi:hypothetical protein [Nannocystis punicea]|uniref:Uncharacterized protein n=1 Tax=Nannocystis punicea TaxID=2995304 RepID=A0ABY7HIU5_9BACT|nr:hypothetical protein [Nannocystis poenicansa]WAS98869.1 hypothetical protein O0S08_22290 [Nannocystis poenicansa]